MLSTPRPLVSVLNPALSDSHAADSWTELVDLLIQYGTDVNTSFNGFTPLGIAIAMCNEPLSHVFLPFESVSPLALVMRNQYRVSFAQTCWIDKTECLLRYGADPNTTFNIFGNRYTLLDFIVLEVWIVDKEFAMRLLEVVLEFPVTRPWLVKGKTLLEYAIENADADLIKLIHDKKWGEIEEYHFLQAGGYPMLQALLYDTDDAITDILRVESGIFIEEWPTDKQPVALAIQLGQFHHVERMLSSGYPHSKTMLNHMLDWALSDLTNVEVQRYAVKILLRSGADPSIALVL
ncbi:hypothetical protein AJ80_06237 [Polytolypa hystricis UAMH7299]|uniref:Ankyrin repeat protein n=1 Tax=Polytolypa hystricis (strain UAMH7299) TaxID=1447883 RepID=A0A2B7XWM5_POLH7|nr:hypothetical protein AJ80_06237 [Polytolypa hystricis UAMH7299]